MAWIILLVAPQLPFPSIRSSLQTLTTISCNLFYYLNFWLMLLSVTQAHGLRPKYLYKVSYEKKSTPLPSLHFVLPVDNHCSFNYSVSPYVTVNFCWVTNMHKKKLSGMQQWTFTSHSHSCDMAEVTVPSCRAVTALLLVFTLQLRPEGQQPTTVCLP